MKSYLKNEEHDGQKDVLSNPSLTACLAHNTSADATYAKGGIVCAEKNWRDLINYKFFRERPAKEMNTYRVSLKMGND